MVRKVIKKAIKIKFVTLGKGVKMGEFFRSKARKKRRRR